MTIETKLNIGDKVWHTLWLPQVYTITEIIIPTIRCNTDDFKIEYIAQNEHRRQERFGEHAIDQYVYRSEEDRKNHQKRELLEKIEKLTKKLEEL